MSVNSVNISQVVAELRNVAQRSGLPTEAAPSTKIPEFGGLLKTALDEVNALQSKSSELATRFEMGDKTIDLPQVMVSMEKAGIAFEATKQVRNRLIAAYQEVMNMPI